MAQLSTEQVSFLLERAGLNLPKDEVERLRYLFEPYLERAKELHSVDVGEEEVASVYRANLT